MVTPFSPSTNYGNNSIGIFSLSINRATVLIILNLLTTHVHVKVFAYAASTLILIMVLALLTLFVVKIGKVFMPSPISHVLAIYMKLSFKNSKLNIIWASVKPGVNFVLTPL